MPHFIVTELGFEHLQLQIQYYFHWTTTVTNTVLVNACALVIFLRCKCLLKWMVLVFGLHSGGIKQLIHKHYNQVMSSVDTKQVPLKI